MSENDGGPAFHETRWDDKTRQEVQWCGMTMRDYFAAAALQGIIAARGHMWNSGLIDVPKEAYALADTMLSERDK